MSLKVNTYFLVIFAIFQVACKRCDVMAFRNDLDVSHKTGMAHVFNKQVVMTKTQGKELKSVGSCVVIVGRVVGVANHGRVKDK